MASLNEANLAAFTILFAAKAHGKTRLVQYVNITKIHSKSK